MSSLTFPHTSTVSSGGTSERAGAKHNSYKHHLHDINEDGDENIFNPSHT